MRPIVGQTVHYHVTQYDLNALKAGNDAELARSNSYALGEAVAAMVVRVWGESCVNLRVIVDGRNGADLWRTSVCGGTLPGQFAALPSESPAPTDASNTVVGPDTPDPVAAKAALGATLAETE